MAILFAVLALLQHDSDWQGTSWPRPICLGLVALQLSNFLAQFCKKTAPENGWFINDLRISAVYICTLHTACYTHGAV